MSVEECRLGIDFGTSTTVAVLAWPDGRTRPLLFDASPLLSSGVFAGPGTDILTGGDARRAAVAQPAGYEANPKRRIDDGTVWLGEREVTVTDLVPALLVRVADEARRVVGGLPATVVLTHPAAWGRTRLGVLTDAARRADLGEIVFVAEPVAAAACFVTVPDRDIPVGQHLVVYDLGAGTFDVSVVSRTETGFEVVVTDGLADVGGLDLDAAVIAHIRGYAGGTPDLWGRLDWPRTPADQQARHALWQGARAAKEQLSRHAVADLHVPLIGADLHLTREEFDKVAQPHLDRTVSLTLATLRHAGVAPETIAGVFLVGGSSRIPLAATLLHRALRIAPTTLDQPELVVADGSVRPDIGVELREPATKSPRMPSVATTASAPTDTHSRRMWSPDPAPIDLRRPLAVLGGVVWVLAAGLLTLGTFGAFDATSVWGNIKDIVETFHSGVRAPVGPTAVLPLLGLALVLAVPPRSADVPLWPSVRRAVGYAAVAALTSTLLLNALAWVASGSNTYIRSVAANGGLGQSMGAGLWLSIAAGVGLCAGGLRLLAAAPGRRGDPLAAPTTHGAGLRRLGLWALLGLLLGASAQTYLYDRYLDHAAAYEGSSWEWRDDEITAVRQLAETGGDWSNPYALVPGIAFLLGNTLTIATVFLLAVILRRSGVRRPALRTPLAYSAAIVLLLGGGLTALHAWRERTHWDRSYPRYWYTPGDPVLVFVRAVWRATIGVSTPGTFAIAMLVAFHLLALLLAVRARRASNAEHRTV